MFFSVFGTWLVLRFLLFSGCGGFCVFRRFWYVAGFVSGFSLVGGEDFLFY